MKKLMITGCALWITGVAATIIGLNLSGTAGQWTTVIGNIIFLVGLGITGALWLKRKKDQTGEKDKQA